MATGRDGAAAHIMDDAAGDLAYHALRGEFWEKARAYGWRAATRARIPSISLKGQPLTIGCGLLLVMSAGIVAWRYQELGKEAVQLESDIAAAQQEKEEAKK